jgi:hypothetical protein
VCKDVTDLSMDNVEGRGRLLGVELSRYHNVPEEDGVMVEEAERKESALFFLVWGWR